MTPSYIGFHVTRFVTDLYVCARNTHVGMLSPCVKTSEPVYSAQKWEDENEKRAELLENMKSRDVAGLRESLRESTVVATAGSPKARGTGATVTAPGSGGGGGGLGGGGSGGGRVRPASARTVQSVRDEAWGVRDAYSLPFMRTY